MTTHQALLMPQHYSVSYDQDVIVFYDNCRGLLTMFMKDTQLGSNMGSDRRAFTQRPTTTELHQKFS